MNLIIIQPATWGGDNAHDFAKWMQKIKSNHYANNEKMYNAFQKFQTNN